MSAATIESLAADLLGGPITVAYHRHDGGDVTVTARGRQGMRTARGADAEDATHVLLGWMSAELAALSASDSRDRADSDRAAYVRAVSR